MPKPKEGYSDLPEDFFNDLADESFIEEVVERDEDDDPQLNRCMEEIKVLEAKIEKKKQNIRERQNGLSVEEMLRQKALECEGMSRSRSRSRDRERRHRERRARRMSRNSRSRSPHGSRNRDRRHIRDRSVSPPSRNRPRGSRSKSPKQLKRSSSTHRNISFLEELAQKFAEKGQAFPEKDALLMGQNQMNSNRPMGLNGPPMPMEFGNLMQQQQQQQLISIPNFQPQQIGYPIQSVQPVQQNMFYGINPMSILAGNAAPTASANLTSFPGLNVPLEIPTIRPNDRIQPMPLAPSTITGSALTENQKASTIERCEHAIKQIRAKDNKVPIMKFLYNRTSMVVSNANDQTAKTVNKSPLQSHSPLNVSFKLNSTSNAPLKPINGLKMLPKRVKNIAQALGINSSFLFDKMRTKELNAQITDKIKSGMIYDESDAATNSSDGVGGSGVGGGGDRDMYSGEILIQTNTVPQPIIETVDAGSQTNELKCEKCTERNRRTMVSAHTQVFLKNCSIGTQTNEKDYREPIVELLSKMTAAQLVAIKDFANIVDEPRARSEMDYTRIRERLIDIYNLSHLSHADAVRTTEENQMDDVQWIDKRDQPSRFRGDAGGSDADRAMHRRDNTIFMRRSNSPRYNGNLLGDRGSFGSGQFGNERSILNERMAMPRGMMDDRFSRMDDQYQRSQPDDDERERDERERQIYLEMERRREMELEASQRRYDEQKLEIERLRLEQERRRQMAMHGFQDQQQNDPFDDDRRLFNRDQDGERDVPHAFNGNRGAINRRGRGAFRGRGSRR